MLTTRRLGTPYGMIEIVAPMIISYRLTSGRAVAVKISGLLFPAMETNDDFSVGMVGVTKLYQQTVNVK